MQNTNDFETRLQRAKENLKAKKANPAQVDNSIEKPKNPGYKYYDPSNKTSGQGMPVPAPLKQPVTAQQPQQVTTQQAPPNKSFWENIKDGTVVGLPFMKGATAEGFAQMADMAPSFVQGTAVEGIKHFLPNLATKKSGSQIFDESYKEEIAKQKAGESTPALQSFRDYAKKKFEKSEKIAEERKVDGESWGYLIGSTFPQIVPLMASVGVGAISPPAGMAMGAATTAGLTAMAGGAAAKEYDEYMAQKRDEEYYPTVQANYPTAIKEDGNIDMDRLKDLSPDLAKRIEDNTFNPTEKAGTMALTMAAEALSEAIPIAKFLPKGYGGLMGKMIFGDTPIMAKQGKELLEEFAKTSGSRAQKVANIVKAAGTGALIEGPTEAFAEVGGELATWLYKDEKHRSTWRNIIDRAFKATVAGGFMGAAIGPVSYGAQHIQNQRRRSEAGKVIIAQDKTTGEAVEIMGMANAQKDGSPPSTEAIKYQAIRPNGKIVEVDENNLDGIIELPLEDFNGLLKGKGKALQDQTNQKNQEKAAQAQQQANEIRNQYQPMAYQGADGNLLISGAKFNGEEAFVTAMLPDGSAVIQKPGEEKKVVKQDGITEVETMPFDQFLETFGPSQEQTQPTFTANPIQKGERIDIAGESYLVTGVDQESGTVVLENENDPSDLPTLQMEELEQYRQATQQNTQQPSTEAANELRKIFEPSQEPKAGDQISLGGAQVQPNTSLPKATPEAKQQYTDISGLIEKKLGVKFDFQPIGLQGEVRTTMMKDFLANNAGEIGAELADIIELPKAAQRFLNNLPDVDNAQPTAKPDNVPTQPTKQELGGKEQPVTENVPQEPVGEATDGEVQVGTKNKINSGKQKVFRVSTNNEKDQGGLSYFRSKEAAEAFREGMGFEGSRPITESEIELNNPLDFNSLNNEKIAEILGNSYNIPSNLILPIVEKNQGNLFETVMGTEGLFGMNLTEELQPFSEKAEIEMIEKRKGWIGPITKYLEGLGYDAMAYTEDNMSGKGNDYAIRILKPTTNELQQAKQEPKAGQDDVKTPQDQKDSTKEGEGQEGLDKAGEVLRTQYPDVDAATTAERLIDLYNMEVQNPEGVSPKDFAISQHISKVNPDSYRRNGDRNNIAQSLAQNWLAKKGSGASIDIIAQAASETFTPGNTDSISPGDVVDFMDRYSSADNITQPSGNPKLKAIADKYKELTGKGINRNTKNTKKELSKKSVTKDEAGNLLETDEQIAEYLANNPEITSFLEANFSEGQDLFDTNGQINYQKALDKLNEDPSWYTVFPGGFKVTELDAIRIILNKQINEQGADKGVQADTKPSGDVKPSVDKPKEKGKADKIGDGITGSRAEQKPDIADPDNAGEPKSGRDQGIGGDIIDGGVEEQLSAKEQKIADELKDLWGQFGAGGQLRSGVSGQDFEIAGKIIAKSAELGLVKFEQMIEWAKENLGADSLRAKYDSFRAAYVARLALNNPEKESLNDIATKNIEDFFVPVKVEEKPKPTQKPEQQSLFEKPKAPQLDLFGNEIKGNETGQPKQNIKSLEDKAAASGSKVKTIKDSESASKQLEEIDSLLTDVEEELKLAGYYNAREKSDQTETPHNEHEKLFQKDLVKYSKTLAKALGWQHDTDKKGKPVYAHANVAPAGGNGTIILWAPDSEYGVYLSFDVQPDYFDESGFTDPLRLQESMMWRMTTKANKYSGLSNQWTKSGNTVGEFAKIIKREAKGYLDKEKGVEAITKPSDLIKAIDKPKQPIVEEKPKAEVKRTKQIKDLKNLLGDITNEPMGWYQTSGEFGDAYMRFSVEKQQLYPSEMLKDMGYNYDGAYKLIMEQNYLQNGDLMTDPRIDLAVIPSEGVIYPLTYEQNGMGIYREYVSDGKVIDRKGLIDTQNFVFRTWMPNLVSQGRAINPNADLEYYGKQGQRGDGQVRQTPQSGNEGSQTKTVSGNDNTGDTSQISSGKTRGNESGDGQAEGTRVRPDNSGGTGKPDTDGDNRGTGTKGFGNSSISEVEKRAEQKNKNKNNFLIPEGFEYPNTFRTAERFEQNIKSLELMAELIDSGRNEITPQEKETLFAYSGFGGLAEVAYDPNSRYVRFSSDAMKSRVEKVYAITSRIDPDGKIGIMDSIKRSINSAHYTEPEIIRSHYDLIQIMGFQSGKILDPSSGIGNYFGAMPENMAKNSNLQAVEMDWITAQIFKRLYPGSKSIVSGLQEAGIGENLFDLAISNIPFGAVKIYDPSWKGKKQPVYRQAQQTVHGYFVVKMIEAVKDGGLISILTSNAVMDTPSNEPIRRYMADNTKFIGAVRLPNNAFQGASGTKVVTDIIFLQKRSAGDQIDQKYNFVDTTKQTKDGSRYNMNQYFIDNPQNILGIIEGGGQYSDETGYTVNGNDLVGNQSIAKNLRERIVQALTEDAQEVKYTPSNTKNADDVKSSQVYTGAEKIRSGNVFEKDGKFYQALEQKSEGNFEGEVINVFKKYEQPFRDFITIRQTLNDLVNKERFGQSDDVLNPIRQKLKTEYNKFVKEHGRLNEFKNTFSEDIDSFQVLALELVDEKGKFKGLADIFEKRTINPINIISKADTPQEAILISLNEFNRINPVRMQGLLGEDWIEQTKGLVFELPDGSYESRAQYLSGNIYEKIQQVKNDPKFADNLSKLEKVLPEPLPIEMIKVPLGARYVDSNVYADFLNELLGYRNIQVNYLEGTDSYKLSRDVGHREYTTQRMSTRELIEKAFSDQSIRINDVIRYPDGSTETRFNPVETAAALAVVDKIKKEWSLWLAGKTETGKAIAETYNRLFNSTVKRRFDGSFMTFPGLSGVKLREHQADAINMIVQNNGGVIDHVVGAGKTLVMIAGAIELKRLGVAKKPLIIAKKSTVPQIAESFRKAYPASKVLAPTEKDFSAQRRKKVLSQIAVNDWDVIILSHDNFGQIQPDPEMARKVIQDEIDLLVLTIEELKGTSDKMSKRDIKGLETRIQNLSAKLAELSDSNKDKEIVDFGTLGIDHIMVDESQSFKNLNYTTIHNQVAGLGTKEGAKKTFNLLMGIRYLQKIHKGDKGTTFLSGTPISNTMAELYLILKYLRPNRLSDIGLNTFDSWAKTFAEKSSELEFGVSGSLKSKERFRRFVNVPELAKLYTDIADVRNDSNLKLPKPGIKGGKEDFRLIKPSRNLEKFYKKLINYASTGNGAVLDIPDFDYMSDAAKKAKMLKVTDLATKASIDLRLIYPQAPYDPNSKLAQVAADVAKTYKESSKHKGVSLVFMDSGKTSGYNDNFNGEKEIKRILVEEFGVPANQIELMANHKDDKKKEKLFPRVNKGDVRILIGSTETMGTGVNVQERVVSMHHVDIPWRPSDYEQRNGRGLRQGNKIAEEFYNNEVDIKVYGVERSLDAYKFELLAIKQHFIDQVKNGATNDRIMDEGEADEDNGASFSEFMAAATGNPVIKEKAKNDKLIDQLQSSREAYFNRQGRAKSDVQTGTEKKINSERAQAQLEKYQIIAEQTGVNENYDLKVNGKSFEKVTEAGEAILKSKPYTETEIESLVRGYKTFSPHATAANGTWEMYLFDIRATDGSKINMYQIAVTDQETGKKWYPKKAPLSQSPVFVANAIKNYTRDIADDIQKAIAFQGEMARQIEQAEKVLGQKWDDQEKYNKALSDQERISKEVSEMNEQMAKDNQEDNDVRSPMFENDGSPDNDIRFSKASDLTKALSKPTKKAVDISDQAAKFTATWNNAPNIVTVNSAQEAYDRYPDLRAKYTIDDVNQATAIFLKNPDTGNPEVAIIASHSYFNNKGSVEKAILHEVIGHYGVREFLKQQTKGNPGKYQQEFKKLMEQVFEAKKGDKFLEDISDRYYGKPSSSLTESQKLIVADEYLAHMAQEGVQDTWVDKVVAKFRQLLRELGINVGLSDAEIRNLLGNSMRIVRGNNGRPVLREGVDQTNGPKFMIAGVRGAANLDQTQESTVRLDNLATARDMEKSGKNANTIRIATGWERGKDNKWRHELSYGDWKDVDKIFDLMLSGEEKIVNLTDIFENQDIYEAYPTLKKQKVSFRESRPGEETYEGFYDPTTGLITILNSKFKAFALGKSSEDIKSVTKGLRGIRSVLIHELQHRIQTEEGFAPGSNPETFRIAKRYRNDLMKHMDTADKQFGLDDWVRSSLNDERIRDLMLMPNFSWDMLREEYAKSLPSDKRKKYLDFINEAKSIIDENMDFIGGVENLSLDPKEAYKRTAGEVEARNAAKRMRMSEEQRRAETLQSTEDVAREDQIRLKKSPGIQASQDQTQTEAFKAWFGDSKVVGEDGKPLVVYHGTDKEFTQFQNQNSNKDYLVSNPNDETYFFADSKKEAEIYGNKNVISAYLSVQNLANITNDGWNLGENTDVIADIINNTGKTNELASKLKELGYDGFVYDDGIAPRAAMDGLHYVVFSPTQIKSATENQGTFDPSNADIRFMKVGASNPDFSAINSKNYETAQLSWFERKVIEPLQDRMIRSKKLINSKTGGKISDKADFYTKENLASGKTLEKARVFEKDLWNPLLETAQKIVKETGLLSEDISNYLKFKHHAERKAYFIEQFTADGKKIPKDERWPTGMTDQEAADGIANFEATVSSPLVKELNYRVHKVNQFTTFERYKAGMITKDTFRDLLTRYKNYVPLTDWKGMETNNDRVYTLLMSAKGRTSESADPMPFMFTAAQEAIMRGENNRVRQGVLEFVKENVSPGDYFIRQAYYVNTKSQDEFGNDIWLETMNKPTKQQIDSGEAMRSFNPNVHRTVQQQGELETVLPVMVKGKKVFIEFTDKEIVSSIKNINQDKLPGFLNHLRGYTRWLSSMYTQYSPEFGVRNLIRDVGFGTFNILVEKDASTAAKTIAKMGRSGATLRTFFATGEYTKGKDGNMLREFMEEGSMTGFTDLKTAADIFKQAKKTIDNANKRNIWKEGGNALVMPLKAVGDAVEVYNKVLENSMRFSYYKTLREQGVSKQQAAAAAKDLTVNFNRKGRSSSFLGSIYIFFNASVQGSERLIRVFVDPKTRKKALQYGGTVMMAGLMQSILYGLFDDEDEDGRTFYEKIPDYTRRNNIIIPNMISDDPNDFIKIPLPYGVNILHSFGESLGQVLTGKKTLKNESLGMLSAMTNVFSPIGGFEFNSDDDGFEQALNFVTPSAVAPISDLAFNRNFSGRPIYRENFTSTQYKRPDSQMYFEGVNPYIKEATTFLNKISGGNEVIPGKIDINPEWIEYGMEQYLGGPVQFTKNVSTTIAHIANGEDISQDPFIRSVPFVRSYIGKTGTDFEARSTFYENRDTAIAAKEAWEIMQEEGLQKDADQFYKENESLIQLGEEFKEYNKYVKQYNQSINELKKMDKELYKDEIDKLYEEKTQIMRQFNKRYGMEMYRKRDNPLKNILNIK
jgi:N12 class adenine-specific DNA methylase